MLVTVGINDTKEVMSCMSDGGEWILCDWWCEVTDPSSQQFTEYDKCSLTSSHTALAIVPMELM